MNFKEIDNFNPRKGERYIFVEQGKAKAVLLSFDDYQKMVYSEDSKQKKNPARQNSLEQSPKMPEIPDFFEEEASPAEEEAAEPEVKQEFSEPAVVENEEPEGNVEEKEALKQELRNELTLDDLPF